MDPNQISLFLRSIVITTYIGLILGILYYLLNASKSLKTSSIEKSDSKNYQYSNNEESPLNLGLILVVVIIIAIITQIKINFNITNTPRDGVVLIMVSVPIILAIIFVVVNLYYRLNNIDKQEVKWTIEEIENKNERKINIGRKLFHIITFFSIFFALFITYMVLETNISDPNNPNYDYYYSYYVNFWGSTDPDVYLSKIFMYGEFSSSKSVIIMLFFVLVQILITSEMARLSNNYFFILQKNIRRNLRLNEIHRFAGYTYFVIGLTFSIIFLPTPMFLSVLSIIAFGDTLASAIGMKWGKHKYNHNNKTVEGTLAGAVCSFVSILLFTGPIYALVGTILFSLIDIYCPKPIRVDDNLFIPVAVTLAFLLLSIIGIAPYSLIGI